MFTLISRNLVDTFIDRWILQKIIKFIIIYYYYAIFSFIGNEKTCDPLKLLYYSLVLFINNITYIDLISTKFLKFIT
jgi:hypothetical protein